MRKIGGDLKASCGTGYSDADYPCYDDKENSLGHSLSSGEFLRCLPLALLDSPAPEQSFMELVANPGFNAWNFVLALIGETSFELFFRMTETCVDSERKIHGGKVPNT